MLKLSAAYLPPIEYFALIAKYSDFYIEKCENFQKQSFRNRCLICGSQGKEMLQVPIIHENGTLQHPIAEVKVDYSTPWVRRTERAVDTAYRSAAFYDYYRDSIFSILESKPETLWDLDLKLTRHLMEKIGLSPGIHFTEEYSRNDDDKLDFRENIHPKKESVSDLDLEKPYFQIFARKHGFISNLSIIDLLFNEGPESLSYLKSL